ncbi:MAG: tryptophan--tRNA ligase [candidate division WOR-3 bacterium]
MKRILTGDRPTGPLHLGHYVGTIINRVKLQYEYDTFILIADAQALTTNFNHPEKLKEDVYHCALDNLACGLDPKVATIFIQTMIPEIAELTIYFSNLVTINVLLHNPTIKTEAKVFGFEERYPYGFLGYPVSQAADITFCKADLVPVGEDQLPHIELTRKIVRRFNELYGPVLVEPEALLSDVPRLPGLDGQKMSKSIGNCIFLKDSDKEIEEKVRRALTDPARIHPNDPGHPEVCVVFTYHKAFNRGEIVEIAEACRRGRIGCVECKKKLSAKLKEILRPIREKRSYYEKNLDLVTEILISGTKKAKAVAERTMAEVRDAMRLNYFK